MLVFVNDAEIAAYIKGCKRKFAIKIMAAKKRAVTVIKSHSSRAFYQDSRIKLYHIS